jgi:hypothetical protein
MAQLGLRKYGSQFTTIEREKEKREHFRREKLIALLNQKLHRAFGLTASNPIIESEIESFVHHSKGEFSELKLKKLKNEIAVRLEPEGILLKTRKASRFGSGAAKAAGMGIVGITTRADHKPLASGSRHSMSVKSFHNNDPTVRSVHGSQMSNRSSSHRSLAESDEWREIQNFNTLLHLEEQNQEILNDKEQQRQMKEELDKQIREKRERVRQEQETEKTYEVMQRRLMNEAERKETLRIDNLRKKVEKANYGRDMQIIMENTIKKSEIDNVKAQEAMMVAKLKKELEIEKLAYKEQRNVQKKQMKQMLTENTNAQFLTKVAVQREREEDERLQKDIMKKLEEQQNKEANDSKLRKEKQQNFVDKMAYDVYGKVIMKNKEEEDKIRRYVEERDIKDRINENRKITKLKREQNDIKDILSRQMKDKSNKEAIDKEAIEEQAKLWKMDREQFSKEEEQLKRKMKSLTNQNAELINKQIHEHKSQNKGMDEMEYGLNKTYLKGIRQKKHQIMKEE